MRVVDGSEGTAATVRVLIESANFRGTSVRNTSRRLSLLSSVPRSRRSNSC